MSQTKAQLVSPIGIVTASGIVVSGVMTASSFDGAVVGSATSIIQGSNLNLGAVNATSFGGDFTGNATGIITSSAIKVGQLTATSFVGDFTGTATSMFKGTGFTAGTINASSFAADVTGNVTGDVTGGITGNITGNVTGNATGIAASVPSGSNIHVGVITATSYHGDGTNLTGIAASTFTSQSVTANSGTTSIDLSAGNVITMNQTSNTTVSFANTSTSMLLSIIRTLGSSTPRTITWPTNITWDGFDEPDLAPKTSDAQVFNLLTRDEGVTWYGWEAVDYDRTSYTIWAYGTSDWGSLGQNSATPEKASSPVQVGTRGVFTRYNGHSASLAIDADGKMWSWGRGADGNTGFNNRQDYSSPKQVGTDTTWAHCFGGLSTLATKTDGTMWAWGRGGKGSLGLSENIGGGPTYRRSSPCLVMGGSNWSTKDRTIWNGSDTTLAIDADGVLWGWGENDQGQLGQNNTTTYSSPVQITGFSDWTIVGGCYDGGSAGIREDGSLWTWGDGEQGNLGQQSNDSKSLPVQIPGTWTDLGNGNNQRAFFGIKSDGTMWTWGHNYYGMLGHNAPSNVTINSPKQLGTETDWAKCGTSGWGYAANIKTDGSIWTQGWGGAGNLGQNGPDNEKRSSPVQIPGTWSSVNCASQGISRAMKEWTG